MAAPAALVTALLLAASALVTALAALLLALLKAAPAALVTALLLAASALVTAQAALLLALLKAAPAALTVPSLAASALTAALGDCQPALPVLQTDGDSAHPCWLLPAWVSLARALAALHFLPARPAAPSHPSPAATSWPTMLGDIEPARQCLSPSTDAASH